MNNEQELKDLVFQEFAEGTNITSLDVEIKDGSIELSATRERTETNFEDELVLVFSLSIMDGYLLATIESFSINGFEASEERIALWNGILCNVVSQLAGFDWNGARCSIS